MHVLTPPRAYDEGVLATGRASEVRNALRRRPVLQQGSLRNGDLIVSVDGRYYEDSYTEHGDNFHAALATAGDHTVTFCRPMGGDVPDDQFWRTWGQSWALPTGWPWQQSEHHVI